MLNRLLTPRVLAVLAAVPLVTAVTFILSALQHTLSDSEGEYIRANTAGFLLPIGLLAAWGGRRAGGAAILLSVCATVFVLMPPHFRFTGKLPSDWIALGFQCLAEGLLVEAIHSAKRSRKLHREAQARAGQERLINDIGHAVRASVDSEEIEQIAAVRLRDALHTDLCFFASPASVMENAERNAGNGMPALVVTDAQTPAGPLTAPWQATGAALRAWIAAPLSGSQQAELFLVAAMAVPRVWTLDEIALTEAVAEQARAALEAARILQRERRIASMLQDALQPAVPPDVPGLDIGFHYKAALEEAAIGGDFYDVFALSSETTALVIGDVSGKGLSAAAQIATVRNMLRYALYQGQPLSEALTQLNQTLAEHDLLPGFVTLFAATFHARSRVLTYVSCGHEPGLLRLVAGGEIEELASTGPVFGIIPGAQYQQCARVLLPGQALLLYTDGASEAGPDRQRQFGVEGLRRLLQEGPPEETAAELAARAAGSVRRHAGGVLHDDLCLLAICAGPSSAI